MTASIDPHFVASTLGLPAQNGAPFSAVVTDSRKIQPGCLFVALPGETFDGHDFIAQAIAQGASGILCKTGKASGKALFFEVTDTVEAYRALGAAWRRRFDIPVVAVAGAVGKTTTKEILAALLRGKWPEVLKTQGSQNGFVGIPMTLLELKPAHGAAVIEVGIDEIGAMAKHMPIVAASCSVLTAIGPEHLEKLVDLPTVAREEGIALSYVASHGGVTVYNLDDEWIRPMFEKISGPNKISFSLKGASGAKIRATYEGGLIQIGSERFELPLPGSHNAANFLAAYATATALGLSPDEIRAGLKIFQPPEGRSQIRRLASGGVAVCDYYNANPTSTEAGLDLLTEEAKGARRWACLADMKELGANEEAFHRGLAKKIAALKIEGVLLHGPRMKWLADELKKIGFTGRLSHHDTHTALAEALLSQAGPGDAYLFKGSHSMRMEEVWKLVQPKLT